MFTAVRQTPSVCRPGKRRFRPRHPQKGLRQTPSVCRSANTNTGKHPVFAGKHKRSNTQTQCVCRPKGGTHRAGQGLESARTREHAFIRTQQTVRDILQNQSTEKTRSNTAANTANTANTGTNRVHTNTRAGEHSTNKGFAFVRAQVCAHADARAGISRRAARSPPVIPDRLGLWL